MIVRPVSAADLPALLDLAQCSGSGLTTLPADERRLAERVARAEQSFRGELEPADADYLFVLVDDEGELLGISAIAAAVGLREPWYNYRLGLTVSASRELGIHRETPTLFLVNDLTGHTELCSLFLRPQVRGRGLGRMLAAARLLFIAEHRGLFGDKLITELRGISEDGHSPFWESLGRHFFKMEFFQADYLTGVGHKAFVAELMPKFPLYTCFLSAAAREALGRVHPDAAPAQHMLLGEGFSHQGYVDIFDAGPALECPTDKARAVRDSQLLVLAVGTPGDEASSYLIHNRRREQCLISVAPARVAAGTLVVDLATARRLKLTAGAQVRAVRLAP